MLSGNGPYGLDMCPHGPTWINKKDKNVNWNTYSIDKIILRLSTGVHQIFMTYVSWHCIVYFFCSCGMHMDFVYHSAENEAKPKSASSFNLM